MKTLIIILALIIFSFSEGKAQSDSLKEKLETKFNGDAKIEVGSFYTGLEFHHSSPLLQRISFYYPSANSIDLSNDYWKRDSSFIMAVGIEVDGKREWIGHDRFEIFLTPYSVKFFKKDDDRAITISYNFCMNNPAFVVTYEIKNLSGAAKNFRMITDNEMSIHTSHSYKLKYKADAKYDSSLNSLYFYYDDPETQNAALFVLNAGEKPAAFSTASVIKKLPVENNNWWSDELGNIKNEIILKEDDKIPAARFLYEKKLNAGEVLKVIQIIGSVKTGEEEQVVSYLDNNFKNEIDDFEKYVLDYAASDNINTGDEILDRSILWAKAVLAVNKHYIDGTIQPMPCPAEYNFYFTHDVLLSDLAAVKFDLPRVKKNLEFIIEHANENKIIPHAYYWRDTAYVTELATPDNWNHFWFIILCGEYFKYSNDSSFIRELFPYMKKSLSETMIHKKDSVMYAYRPDWWDIGRNYGPRSFMTILAIKSLQIVHYLSKELNPDVQEFSSLENGINQLHSGLINKLWNDSTGYLMNYYEDGSLDPHYYIGPLLAAHFGLLDNHKLNELLVTASKKLLDPKLGVYTTYPMDVHEMIDYLKLVGNEAGDPYKYINGGIWQHGNAWYALALIKAHKRKEAIDFIKTTMTLDGVINSPNGQPAMYEYRNSNRGDEKVYGEIDKPQFMWAAAWYLYCIYELYGEK